MQIIQDVVSGKDHSNNVPMQVALEVVHLYTNLNPLQRKRVDTFSLSALLILHEEANAKNFQRKKVA